MQPAIAAYQGTVTTSAMPVPTTVSVVLHPHRVVATTATGEKFEIPFASLTLESGGFDGGFVFCRPSSGAFTIAVSDRGIVDQFRAIPELAPQVAHVRGQRARRGRGKVFSMVGFSAVAIGLGVALWQLPAILASQVTRLPSSVDETIGDAAIESTHAGPIVSDPRVTKFLDEIVARLSPVAKRKFNFRVRVVRNEQVNAFALPGGHMVVFTGLLEKATDPAQVYGVMAHEFSHVTLRHGLRNVAHGLSTSLALQLLLGDLEGLAGIGASLAVSAQQNNYSRDQETDADGEGVRMLLGAGLDPEGLASFFTLLKDEPGSELGGVLNWFSTHPEHDARIRHVRGLARQLPHGTLRPLSSDWSAVKAALAELEAAAADSGDERSAGAAAQDPPAP